MTKSLRDWLAEGALRPHSTSAREIADLLRVVERDLADAAVAGLSTDRRFAIAYNAILQMATIILRVKGYRTAGAAHHWVTIHVLPEILGEGQEERADYFDACRRKRNTADYDAAGRISAADAVEIVAEAERFKEFVLRWLRAERPDLLP